MSDKPNYYAVIPASVRYDEHIKPAEKLMYGEITALSNKTGECWATNEYFAALYGVHKNTVSLWIANLVRRGYVRSVLIYKNGTREIEKRIIKITDTYQQKPDEGSQQIGIGGINENLKENNTRVNTTRDNTPYVEYVECDHIYSLYPRKVGRGQAIKAIRTALKEIDAKTLADAVATYARCVEGKEKRFIPHCATWMNGKRWMDDRSEWGGAPTSTPSLRNEMGDMV